MFPPFIVAQKYCEYFSIKIMCSLFRHIVFSLVQLISFTPSCPLRLDCPSTGSSRGRWRGCTKPDGKYFYLFILIFVLYKTILYQVWSKEHASSGVDVVECPPSGCNQDPQ